MIGRSCCRSLLGLQPWLQWENTKINAFFPHNCCFSLKNAVLVTRWSLLWSDLGCSPPNISGLAHLFYCIKDSGSWPSTCVGDFSCHQNIDCLILQRKKSLWFENKGSQRKLNQPDSKTSKRQCPHGMYRCGAGAPTWEPSPRPTRVTMALGFVVLSTANLEFIFVCSKNSSSEWELPRTPHVHPALRRTEKNCNH